MTHVPDIPAERKLSDQLDSWLQEAGPRTLGNLIDTFGEKAFAVAFLLLMAPAALPLPTGGVTHVLEVVTMLLAFQLIVGRRTIWLPRRWQRLDLGGSAGGKFASALTKRIRWIERFSHPRLRFVFGHRRLSGAVFGALVFALSLTAFVAPPFSGLDTLPALGVVLLATALLLEDIALAVLGLIVGALGVALVFVLGNLVLRSAGGLF